jgi:Cytochrome P460
MHKRMLIIVVLTIGFFYAGCKGQETPTERGEDIEITKADSEGVIPEIEQKVEKIYEEHAKEEAVKVPPEIAAELWSLIQTENYREHWKMWPGKEALYKGTHPHGTLLTTYVNSTGYDAVVKKENQLPPGTMIVMENYMPDKTLKAIDVMYNLVPFDPEHGNWFWVNYAPDGKPMTMEKDGETTTLAGKVPDCIECHTASSSGIQFIMISPE